MFFLFHSSCDCERDCPPHPQETGPNNTQRILPGIQSAREQPFDINMEGLAFFLIMIVAAVLLVTIAVLVCSIVNGFPERNAPPMLSPPLPCQPPITRSNTRASGQSTTTRGERRQIPTQPNISCISPGSEQIQAIRMRIRRE